MKKTILSLLGLLLLVQVVSAQQVVQPTWPNESTVPNIVEQQANEWTGKIQSFLFFADPVFLVIIGIVIYVASGMAKWVGLIVLGFGVIRLLLAAIVSSGVL